MNLKRVILFITILMTLSLTFAASFASAVEEGEVNVNTSLNVRSAPGTWADVVGTKQSGERVTFTDEGNGWGRLTDGTGYVSLEWIKRGVVTSSDPGSGGQKRIMLDPGHGGHDSGAAANGLLEKNVVLDISRKTKAILEEHGYTVSLTRNDDVFLSLEERVARSNTWGADQFISIHANGYTDPNANGIETYYHPSSPVGKTIATSIQSGLINETNGVNRGVKEETFYVLRNSTVPAALVEVGFITNQNDASKLANESYRSQLAQAIAKGIMAQ